MQFPDPSPPLDTNRQTLAIRFTGSGSEYFRIWIVNVLLTLVTFSLYLPFARARRLAYFHGNTVVGHDPLAFHGDPWAMFRGYLLVLATAGIGWATFHLFPQWLAAFALLVLMAWPWLWHASLRFRLGHTSWRGVRMAFSGSLGGAYACLLPFALPLLAMVVAIPWLAEAGKQGNPQVHPMLALSILLTFLGTLVCLPWLAVRVIRYKHSGFVYAQQQTQLKLDAWSFYKLSFQTSSIALACLLVMGGAIFAYMTWAGTSELNAFVFNAILLLVVYGFIPLLVQPYVVSRRQNLLWSHTRSSHVVFSSGLCFGPLFRLNAMNWLLIAITLGLYWPFAQVRTTRLRMEAVRIQVEGDINGWKAQRKQQAQGALGDGAADFLGIEVGM